MKRWVILIAAAAFGPLWLSACTHRSTPRRAILITIDALRPDHTSLYGYPRDTTPNLRRYFGDAWFRHARSSAPCTLPSVKQFLTGRLDMKGPTIAEVLKAAGFRTAAVTSQHWFVGDPLYRRGFDYWNVQGKDELDRYGMSDRRADRVTDLALEWLHHRKRHDRFFLWVHYFDPHDPYDPPTASRLFSKDVTRFPHGDRRRVQLAACGKGEKWYEVDRVFDDRDRDALRRLYDDEIRFTDREIGRLLDGMKARGLLDGTVVVLAADHGERLGEHGVWDHCNSLHDLEIRVPLAVRGLDDSLDVESPAGTLDIFPTLVQALGVPAPDGLEGASLRGPRPGAVTVSSFRNMVAVAGSKWKLYLDQGAGDRVPVGLVRLGGGMEGTEVPLADGGPAVERLREAANAQAPGLEVARKKTAEEFELLRSIGYTN